jgi:hypothetical protein
MSSALDSARFQAAQARFVSFFRELAGTFMEREDVLMQLALGLLCREHVLLTGPPGTAKSLLASSVLGRLIDEETGSPSLYARQFTESTVQTDLVGPINFKTLTETGRTEHFTDEGILGAVHAFLDEVFDGRDMLLRATLNVLHERELKQGTRITRGRFECAVMASNRYIADVLESSRETLLAFVDRIAFVGFVPRGFADPGNLTAVLRGQVGGDGRRRLESPLLIQDLDVLQHAVDAVYISDAICEGLAALLDLCDAELHAAERADPTFIPTRYLSTRTAVRCGRILRAICVYEKLFHEPERPLEVLPKDLMGLRLHLLLSGPSLHAVGKLLERESDPRERRQLSILRTEREVFDRSWAKLPPIRVVPRPVAAAVPAGAGTGTGAGTGAGTDTGADANTGTDASAGAAAKHESAEVDAGWPGINVARAPSELERKTSAAIESGDTKLILDALREIIPVSRGGGGEAERAAGLLKQAAAALQAKAIRAHLAPGAEEKVSALDVASELADFADELEGGASSMRPLAKWLRARALELIGDAASYALSVPATELEAETASRVGRSAIERAVKRVEVLELLAAKRDRLLARGADPAGRKVELEAWERGVAAAEDEAVLLCDAALQTAAAEKLAAVAGGDLSRVLAELAPDFDRIERLDRRIEDLRDRPSSLKARVIGPRLGLVVEAAFARLDVVDRAAFGGQIEAMLHVLQRAGLSSVIAPKAWVTWTAEALLRSDTAVPAEELADELRDPTYDGYRRVRSASERVPSAFVLAEVALRVAPDVAAAGETPEEGLEALAGLLAGIPEPARGRAVSLDVERITRAVTYLERWWDALAQATPLSPERADELLKVIVGSRFFDVLLDESALARFVLEAKLVAELFPDRAPEATALRARVDALQERSRRRVMDLVRARADAAWAATLGADAALPAPSRAP